MQWFVEFQLHAVAPKRPDGTFTVEVTLSQFDDTSVELTTYSDELADVSAKLMLRLLSRYVITVLLLKNGVMMISDSYETGA